MAATNTFLKQASWVNPTNAFKDEHLFTGSWSLKMLMMGWIQVKGRT